MSRRLSNQAFAVMAACERSKETFGITVDSCGNNSYRFIWSFKIRKEIAKQEGYDSTNVTGNIENDEEFPGCPYCKAKLMWLCGTCKKWNCWHEQNHVTCAHCGTSGECSVADSFDLRGGGF